MDRQPEPAARTVLSVLTWAAFLACSWTWCIGMFLPALLLRDYGIWGFLVFAAPNVVGAAGMGWVLTTRQSAATLAFEHRRAVASFSTATLAFHVYWLCWIGTWAPTALALDRTAVSLVIFPAIAVFLLFLAQRPYGLALLSAPLLVLSLGVFGLVLARTGLTLPTFTQQRPEPALLWLAPVCVFGFALCPYLDRTFLTARAELPGRQARAAFSIGFGLFFLAMILLTLAYAPMLLPLLGGTTAPFVVGVALLAHLLLQAAFTVAAHVRCAESRGSPDALRWGALLVAALVGVLVRVLPGHAGLDAGEVVYRLFMGLYGLVFPTYVWLVVIPARRGQAPPGSPQRRRLVRVFAAAVGLALPMFWMGFIERREVFLAPGLAIVLLARLFTTGAGKSASMA
ncbi:MAG: hypothetical protein DYG94_05685 [Leptolyngbya sp. PLA3]|nr:MAG: hypothetical protein EDM82_04435 [Cyanobacteria bacterium CYA]MCE7968224.1 hypothetical protein [Leptolyngbya sp. PL-A3]